MRAFTVHARPQLEREACSGPSVIREVSDKDVRRRLCNYEAMTVLTCSPCNVLDCD